MKLNRSMWRAVLAVLLVVLPLTALAVVPAVGAADPVLYSQMNNPGDIYVQSMDFSEAGDPVSVMTADDFVVTSGERWQISQVAVEGRHGNAADNDAAEPSSFNIFIYTNASNDPGVRIYSARDLSYQHIVGGHNYAITLPTPATLSEGTYWLVVQGNSTVAGVQYWEWLERTVQTGTQAQFTQQGAASGLCDATFWNNRTICNHDSAPDQLFELYGLKLPNQPPVNTVPGAQGPVNDNVNLTFSIANGNAISVADPDADPYNVEVTLSVLHGTLTLATTNNIVTDDGAVNVTRFIGTLAAVNAAMNGLIYNPADGFGGVDTLTITTNDFGNTGSGGTKSDSDSVAIAVKARTQLNLGTASIPYGGGTASLSACLDTVVNNAETSLSGQTIVFKFDGNVIGTGTTGTTSANGACTNLTSNLTLPGLNAGNYANRLTAEFAGSTYLLPSTDTTSTLTIQKRILYVKPVDREVALKQPNPPTTPPAGCAPTGCWLELTNGSTFVNGDTWAALNFTNLRFQYSRVYPSGTTNEKAGTVYRITALGATSTNYDLRFQPGTLTVK